MAASVPDSLRPSQVPPALRSRGASTRNPPPVRSVGPSAGRPNCSSRFAPKRIGAPSRMRWARIRVHIGEPDGGSFMEKPLRACACFDSTSMDITTFRAWRGSGNPRSRLHPRSPRVLSPLKLRPNHVVPGLIPLPGATQMTVNHTNHDAENPRDAQRPDSYLQSLGERVEHGLMAGLVGPERVCRQSGTVGSGWAAGGGSCWRGGGADVAGSPAPGSNFWGRWRGLRGGSAPAPAGASPRPFALGGAGPSGKAPVSTPLQS